MKTKERTKEEVINDIVHYVSTEEMDSIEAEHFYDEIHTALFEYFHAEEEEE